MERIPEPVLTVKPHLRSRVGGLSGSPTRYSYNAYDFVSKPELSGEEYERNEQEFLRVIDLVKSDKNIEKVRQLVYNNRAYSLVNTMDYGTSTFLDGILASSDTGIAMMLVRDFGANPNQRDASNNKSAVEYATEEFGEHSVRANYMRFLADEFERTHGYVGQFFQ